MRKILLEAYHGAGKGWSEPVPRLKGLHKRFGQLCRDAGIAENDYPFNVLEKGLSGFSRWIKRAAYQNDIRAAVAAEHGDEAGRRLGNLGNPTRSGSAGLALERVEFDGHRLDTEFEISVNDPTGGPPISASVGRPWFLTVIDSVSRAVLGWHLSLSENYTKEDVLTCFENALVPWKPRHLTVPSLSYPNGSGLPSGVIPELAYATWGELAFDNAMSNLSHAVWERVRDVVGCQLNPGPVRSPENRRCIERYFLTLEKNGIARLPSTTGGRPTDPRKRERKVAADRYSIRLDELLDVLDILVAGYNATPSDALFGRSPNEYLRFEVKRSGMFVRSIPESERNPIKLSTVRDSAFVRGNPKKGKKLSIRFQGVSYFSERLSVSPEMMNQKVYIEYNLRDLRELRVFRSDGLEFGTVRVAQAWSGHAHDIHIRRAILACIRQGRIARSEMPDVIQAFIDFKAQEAFKSKKARSQLERVRRCQAAARQIVSVPEQPYPPSRPPRKAAPVISTDLQTINF